MSFAAELKRAKIEARLFPAKKKPHSDSSVSGQLNAGLVQARAVTARREKLHARLFPTKKGKARIPRIPGDPYPAKPTTIKGAKHVR